MKNPFFRVLGALTALTLLTSPAFAKVSEPPRLAVRIDTPTVFDLSAERDIGEALAVTLSDTFRRRGFEGRIAQIDRRDDAPPGIPVLEITLLDWRVRPSGFVECRFTSTLTDLSGETIRLGSYYGTAVDMGLRTPFSARRSFEDAAQNAMRNLYRDFAKLDTARADLLSK